VPARVEVLEGEAMKISVIVVALAVVALVVSAAIALVVGMAVDDQPESESKAGPGILPGDADVDFQFVEFDWDLINEEWAKGCEQSAIAVKVDGRLVICATYEQALDALVGWDRFADCEATECHALLFSIDKRQICGEPPETAEEVN
jgi:hypothetical protein